MGIYNTTERLRTGLKNPGIYTRGQKCLLLIPSFAVLRQHRNHAGRRGRRAWRPRLFLDDSPSQHLRFWMTALGRGGRVHRVPHRGLWWSVRPVVVHACSWGSSTARINGACARVRARRYVSDRLGRRGTRARSIRLLY
jgi:hypothetical protein